MERVRDVLRERIWAAVEAVAGGDALREHGIDVTIEIPDNTEHGDYTTTVALELGNALGEDPRQFAEELVDRMDRPDFVEDVAVAGPGFINMTVEDAVLGERILAAVTDLAFEETGTKIVVEHTSPNPNKPLHMGTMRCAVLGDTIARLGAFLGHTIEVQDLINDLGRQSATTVYAHRHFLDELDEEDQEEKADFWVGLLYSKAAEHIEDHPDASRDVDEIIRAIEEGSNDTAAEKDELVKQSLTGQLETAFRTNVFYDTVVFERDIVASKLYEEGIKKMKGLERVYEVKQGEDKGCIVLDLSDFEDELGELRKPYKILVRSDGTATYVAKDIALTMWKFGLLDADLKFTEFMEQPNGEPLWSSGGDQEKGFGDADQIINVIGAEQQYPQTIIRYALKALGFDDAFDNFSHMHFKFVYLPGRVAYSGRKGNWVGKHGDAVLDRTYELALDEVEERHDDLSEEEQEAIAEKVGVAAVRYFLLKFTREKDIDFSFEKALDWEGDSGPYLLYSLARAHGIMDKVDEDGEYTTHTTEEAYDLLRKLEGFPDAVERAFDRQEPAQITHELKRLAELFNSFYHAAPVKQEDDEALRRSRLALVEAFSDVMEQGLDLLGIDPLEEM